MQGGRGRVNLVGGERVEGGKRGRLSSKDRGLFSLVVALYVGVVFIVRVKDKRGSSFFSSQSIEIESSLIRWPIRSAPRVLLSQARLRKPKKGGGDQKEPLGKKKKEGDIWSRITRTSPQAKKGISGKPGSFVSSRTHTHRSTPCSTSSPWRRWATGHHNAMDWGQTGRLETYCPREILSHFLGKYFVPGDRTFCEKMSMGRKFLSHFWKAQLGNILGMIWPHVHHIFNG